jgi:hypothetical protein
MIDRTNNERQRRWRQRQAENAKLAEEYRRLNEEGATVSNASANIAGATVSNADALAKLKAELEEREKRVAECERLIEEREPSPKTKLPINWKEDTPEDIAAFIVRGIVKACGKKAGRAKVSRLSREIIRAPIE